LTAVRPSIAVPKSKGPADCASVACSWHGVSKIRINERIRDPVAFKFPENREFNREFLRIRPFRAFLCKISQINQRLAPKFPEMAGTGNFSARTGNFLNGTGNSLSLSGSVETLQRSRFNTWFRHSRPERSEGSSDSIPDGMESGLAAGSGKPDLAAPRNDAGVRSVRAGTRPGHGLRQPARGSAAMPANFP
jgi:hypothetical protein